METHALFSSHFSSRPETHVSAPGRVELLGNHTDYNGGFVLSVALDMKVYMCGAKRDDSKAEVYSNAFDESCSFDVNNFSRDENWGDYIKGVVDELRKKGKAVGGFEAVIDSTVPFGTGLSSSAALEVAASMLLRELYPYDIEPFELAKMCRAAENNFVGMNCGILDQFSSIFGKENAVLFLDCRNETHDVLPLDRDDISIVICNSMKKHALVSSQYNARRQECLDAAEYFGKISPEVTELRDVTPEMFEAHKDGLEENRRKRAEHVIYENQRVLKGCDLLKKNEFAEFGKLMMQSHESSRDLFENSTPELDFLQKTASEMDGVIGTKLSGGGFGGAVIVLAEKEASQNVVETLNTEYKHKTGITPEIHFTLISDGAGPLPMPSDC